MVGPGVVSTLEFVNLGEVVCALGKAGRGFGWLVVKVGVGSFSVRQCLCKCFRGDLGPGGKPCLHVGGLGDVLDAVCTLLPVHLDGELRRCKT